MAQRAASQTHPSRQWEGRRQQAEGGFSQLIILGKGRYKFHGWNARVVKLLKTSQRGPRMLLPGRQWEEGWQQRVGEQVTRGVAFWEAGTRASKKKKKSPGPGVGYEPEIGLCLLLKKKMRPVSERASYDTAHYFKNHGANERSSLQPNKPSHLTWT